MTIIWHGQSFFEVQTKDREGNEVKIAVDPFDETLGLRVPKIGADILLISHPHPDHSNKKAITGTPFVVEEPGEYELKGIFIKGIPAFHDNSEGKERGMVTIYKMEAEDVKICHLSDLGQKELNESQLEEMAGVDILMISIGGPFTDAKTCADIVSQIEPRMVIPMHYKIPKLKVKIDGPEKFFKTMGAEKTEPQKKLKVSLKDLPKEETEIVVLQP